MDGFDLRARQLDARLVGLFHEVVVVCFFVVGCKLDLSFHLSHLECAKFVEGEKPEDNPAHDVVLGDEAHLRASRVVGHRSVIAAAKIHALGDGDSRHVARHTLLHNVLKMFFEKHVTFCLKPGLDIYRRSN